MQAEDRIRCDVIEHTFFQHKLCTAVLTFRRTFLGGLEDEHDRTGQFITHCRQHPGCAQQHGHVGVVAAGVHYAHVLAVVLGGYFRGKGQAGFLGDRQGIHIRAQRHHRSGLSAFQNSDDAGMGNAGLHVDIHGPEGFGNLLCSLVLAVGELRVGMEMTAQLHHLAVGIGGQFVQCRLVWQGYGECRQQADQGQAGCLDKVHGVLQFGFCGISGQWPGRNPSGGPSRQ